MKIDLELFKPSLTNPIHGTFRFPSKAVIRAAPLLLDERVVKAICISGKASTQSDAVAVKEQWGLEVIPF
jgi:hypothetical protein